MDTMKAVIIAGILIVVACISIFWMVQYSQPQTLSDPPGASNEQPARPAAGEKKGIPVKEPVGKKTNKAWGLRFPA